VLRVSDLPPDVWSALSKRQRTYKQMIVLGHAGPLLWQTLQSIGAVGNKDMDDNQHPIDDAVRQWGDEAMHIHAPHIAFEWVYPGPCGLSLTRLGECLGWHHPSPFWQGVDAHWGSWWAYRAVWLANTDWPVSGCRERDSPCATCSDKPCVRACPAKALQLPAHQGLPLCGTHRLQPDSCCAHRCEARLACPVGAEHRYDAAQLQHHYRHSLAAIRRHQGKDQTV
jgi:epoxyqueuosine reductase